MALKKWGEVKNERGYLGALVGGAILALIGLGITPPGQKVYGVLVGFVLGFFVGHMLDSVKTIIYKEEEKKEQ